MIVAAFKKKNHCFQSVQVSGHAQFEAYGKDIVCAAVSSAVQLCANGITEILKAPAQVTQKHNLIAIDLGQPASTGAQAFLEALWLHLTGLSEEYPDNIQTTTTEV